MTKKKDPKDLQKLGRPTLYRPEFCQMLIEHQKQGGSFESFASLVPCTKDTLYDWLIAQPDFLHARIEAEGHLRMFYETLGKKIAAGQLVRIKSEKPVIHRGKPVIDPTTGRPMMVREFEPTAGNATAYIWLTRNMLGWRNEMDVHFKLPPAAGDTSEKLDGKTPKERFQEISEAMKLVAELQQELEEEANVIDVTPAKQA